MTKNLFVGMALLVTVLWGGSAQATYWHNICFCTSEGVCDQDQWSVTCPIQQDDVYEEGIDGCRWKDVNGEQVCVDETPHDPGCP